MVWFPEDWSSREHPTILTVLHGSVGCQEAMFADARWAFGDHHALISLSHKDADGGFIDAQAIQIDLDETVAAVAAACPIEEATHLMYGLSRGGLRAIQLGGLDRAGPQRLAAVVSDSGTAPTSVLQGASYAGARFFFWCGEYDPDPTLEGRMTCDVLASDLTPYLERAGATVDGVLVGDSACHGMFTWDCSADCLRCTGRTNPEQNGPHAAEVGVWLAGVAPAR